MGFFDFLKPARKVAPIVADVRSVPCENCGMPAPYLDEVDFNKSCEEANNVFLHRSGRMVGYYLCDACGFCFAPEFRTWTIEEFAAKIYNDDYVKVDPEYVFKRPYGRALELNQFLDAGKEHVRHLDYGGGSGLLSKTLKENGWNSRSYDPMIDVETDVGQLGTYNFVTAFEVFEHVPDINALADTLAQLCGTGGVIMFTTCCSDGEIRRGRELTWWYAAPRNGHISLFSVQSLALLLRKRGLSLVTHSSSMHIAFRSTLPDWFPQLTT